ncbi:DUF418 domain-containing protein [Lysobacter korlensis]|uniref:DUF418 domain-containing protein n=1 Tax=Lysobacter korlensis TaxID=553636 RepID=A0ABV6RNB0_9GAMM
MNAATRWGPVATSERIGAMDVLRGFALLGILLMNIEAMVGPLNAAMTGVDPSLRGVDRWVDTAIYVLVQGKFYTLFSLLFGMGFAVMMRRADAAGRPFVKVYLRRTLGLLAIGLVHMLAIWSGDILTVYAVLSLALLWGFRNKATAKLPRWALGMYLIPVVLMLLLGALVSLSQLDPKGATEAAKQQAAQLAETARMINAQRAAYGGGDYLAAVAQRWDDMVSVLTFVVIFGWQVLAMFVLGLWFVRSGAIERPGEFPRLYSRLRFIALPVGLALMLASVALEPTLDGRMDIRVGAAAALAWVASLLMCLGYFAWVMHGLKSPPWASRLAIFAPAGRMALTNYLMQSVIGTLVFYGYGLGWFEQLPRAWQVPFVLVLFGLQVLWSHWWLARFRYGPAEWLWRAFTYGGRPPLRLERAHAP